MLRLCILNSIMPKIQSPPENLVSKKRNWFSDGYRVSAPGTSTCRSDTDCEINEICQSGYCSGLKRPFGTFGIFYNVNSYGKQDRLITNRDWNRSQGNVHDYSYDYGY